VLSEVIQQFSDHFRQVELLVFNRLLDLDDWRADGVITNLGCRVQRKLKQLISPCKGAMMAIVAYLSVLRLTPLER
jgi:hypothetical protein